MKVLHTSDWHIGKRLYNKDFDQQHELFFKWLCTTISEHLIDVLIVAGDIFDVAYPSNSSLSIYYKALISIQQTGCKYVIITGGNHDSPSTLNAPKEILTHLNIYVIGGAAENPADHLIPLYDNNNQIQLVVAAVPFLRDKDIRKSNPGETFEEKAQAVSNGIANYYKQLENYVEVYKLKNIPVIATGHFFISDASMDTKEHELYIGGLQQLKINQLPSGFDYIALGHIHRGQKIGNSEHIRYSGSPIALSFNERAQQKSVVKINFGSTNPEITLINVPQFRNLIRFTGTFKHVSELIKQHISSTLLSDYAELFIEEDFYDSTLLSEIQLFTEQCTTVEILNYRILIKNKNTETNPLHETILLKDVSVNDIFNNLLINHTPESATALKQTFEELKNALNTKND